MLKYLFIILLFLITSCLPSSEDYSGSVYSSSHNLDKKYYTQPIQNPYYPRRNPVGNYNGYYYNDPNSNYYHNPYQVTPNRQRWQDNDQYYQPPLDYYQR